MRKTHRKIHRVFWLLAGPLMLLFLFSNLPDHGDVTELEEAPPPGASTARLQ